MFVGNLKNRIHTLLKKNHILAFLMVAFFFALPIYAQDRDTVCIGAKAMYRANGLNGSTFEYKLDQPHAGTIFQKDVDTIIVEWSNIKGVFQLGVLETSQYGCDDGNWAYLNVEVVGDYAQFSQPVYSMCGGGGVFVEFNKSNFRAYEWKGNTVPIDGYVTKPGRYELITIDENHCRLSSFIEVVQTPTPQISLGADTMVCTPGFTLYAYNTQNNPEGTTYTWSTGVSNTSARSIIVDNHNAKANNTYWVTAEFNGCSVSDTIVVLACVEVPEYEKLKIPNTFTPNADGDNDVWNISALRDYPECMVEVFDRWGRKVFTSARGYSSNPWDGRDGRGHYLPMEAYYYIINLNDGKTKKPITGTITIIR